MTLAEGFWLFDTPCTQALWQAVMGENPSEFKSPTRPVEQVSFEDVQAFLDALNGLVPGSGWRCRRKRSGNMPAGRDGRRRPMRATCESSASNNAPVLDAIAWYGGNSGVGFELENGTTQRLDGEAVRPHDERARGRWRRRRPTRGVCMTCWGTSGSGVATTGMTVTRARQLTVRPGPTRRGCSAPRRSRRVLGRRRARRACRVPRPALPACRNDILGFRCARVQSDSVVSETERRAGRSKRRERSDQAATTSPKRR